MRGLKSRLMKLEAQNSSKSVPFVMHYVNKKVVYLNEQFAALEEMRNKYPHFTNDNIMLCLF